MLIYGAGSAGLALLWEHRQLILHGKRVLGSGESPVSLVRKHPIERLLIALPSATGPQMVRIMKQSLDAGVDYKMGPAWANCFKTWNWANRSAK